jgi:hypothetical protein
MSMALRIKHMDVDDGVSVARKDAFHDHTVLVHGMWRGLGKPTWAAVPVNGESVGSGTTYLCVP